MMPGAFQVRVEPPVRRWRPPARRSLCQWLVLAALVAPAALPLAAQTGPLVERPVPGPVVPPRFFRAAVAAGTRSSDGRPGPGYWQPWTTYQIDARLEPATARLSGNARIRYENRSPHGLRGVVLNLYQNLHTPGAVRNEAQEVTGGIELRSVRVNGQPVPAFREGTRTAFYQVRGTLLTVPLATPLAAGGSVDLELQWEVTLPENGAGRMGHSDHEVYFVAYWFPKIAVFDDLRGWDAEPYLGAAEFYDGFGDYEVALTVPVGWTVMGTGTLQNGAEVLGPATLARLAQASEAEEVVHVVTRADRDAGTVTTTPATGELTYRFRAANVRDFAWTASNVQLWDATSALVGDQDGDGREDRAAVYAFWREDRAPTWSGAAEYARTSLEHHSRATGIPYPWPHVTSVEGDDIMGGGMEFPMLTLMGPYRGSNEGLHFVTAHELGHMWVPMIVGSNERRHAWMDEGSTTFLEAAFREEHLPGSQAHAAEREGYLQVARAEMEEPLMRHGDYYQPGPGYGVASYAKPASLLYTLRALMGEDAFTDAYRTFHREWAYKHPTPWDFFNTFERFAGQDLDWFWQSFYYETWTLDHAVLGVQMRGGAPLVVIGDLGFAVMPAAVIIETTQGGTLERRVEVTEWLAGRTRVELELPASVGQVTSVRIGPGLSFLDANPSNNVWTPSR